MRRLLQLGTWCLFLAAFITPLVECFDRWDEPGIANDTEFAVFALILTLCLVLLVSKLLSVVALAMRLVAQSHSLDAESASAASAHSLIAFFVPPLSSPPLRI